MVQSWLQRLKGHPTAYDRLLDDVKVEELRTPLFVLSSFMHGTNDLYGLVRMYVALEKWPYIYSHDHISWNHRNQLWDLVVNAIARARQHPPMPRNELESDVLDILLHRTNHPKTSPPRTPEPRSPRTPEPVVNNAEWRTWSTEGRRNRVLTLFDEGFFHGERWTPAQNLTNLAKTRHRLELVKNVVSREHERKHDMQKMIDRFEAQSAALSTGRVRMY